MPQVMLGGKNGEVIQLKVDPDLPAVLRSHRSLRTRPVPGPEAALVDGMEIVLAVPKAGVEVYRRRDAAAGMVAEVKEALSRAPDTRFAGRVLVDEQMGDPVLDTENIFIKFRDDAERRVFAILGLFGVGYVHLWSYVIHVNILLDEHKLCLLVMIDVRADGRKELVALTDGYRESTESWADLLRDCARRGFRVRAGGLKYCPGKQRPGGWGDPKSDRVRVRGAQLDPNDAARLSWIRRGGLESFATVRHHTKVTQGPGSRAAGLAMAFKLVEAAQVRWLGKTSLINRCVHSQQATVQRQNCFIIDAIRSCGKSAAINDRLSRVRTHLRSILLAEQVEDWMWGEINRDSDNPYAIFTHMINVIHEVKYKVEKIFIYSTALSDPYRDQSTQPIRLELSHLAQDEPQVVVQSRLVNRVLTAHCPKVPTEAMIVHETRASNRGIKIVSSPLLSLFRRIYVARMVATTGSPELESVAYWRSCNSWRSSALAVKRCGAHEW